MRVMIMGIDGYLGWTLALHLTEKGHDVAGMDCYNRRNWVAEMQSQSATPILRMTGRLDAFMRKFGKPLRFIRGDVRDYVTVENALKSFKPECIVHLAEMPSAPFSMIDVAHCNLTHVNNLLGTLNILHAVRDVCPDCHILKLGCYDDKTEVLTEDGWKKFEDLTYSDLICCLDPETEKILYHHPEAIVDYPYDGDMFSMKTSTIDCMVTPNHRIVFKRPKNRGIGSIEICCADELPDIHFYIPRSGKWEGICTDTFEIPGLVSKGPGGREYSYEPVKYSIGAWLEFFGIWIADGCIRKVGGEPKGLRISLSKLWKIERLRQVLEELGVHASENVNCDGMTVFEIGSVQLAAYLSRFGKAHTKYVPPEYKRFEPALLKRLYDGLMFDGHKNESGTEYFFSVSDRLLDDMQEIALKLGKGPTLCTHNRLCGRVEKYLSIGSSNLDTFVAKPRRTWKEYSGRVYCCTVPTGIIMVRRNGRICWSGNTMGELGTPNIDIPEGFFEIEYRGRKDILPFPCQPGSFYHATKVHDSVNIRLACKVWGLRSTDIMQGVVYGVTVPAMICQDGKPNEALFTRFDFDQAFGTAINRYVAQAIIGEPITPFGAGHQRRGFLPLRDSMQCLTLAIENPPKAGEYRVFNQFEEVYDITDLANIVAEVASKNYFSCSVKNIDNPRMEAEEHYYNPDHKHLVDLGYRPSRSMDEELSDMFSVIGRYKDRIMAKRYALTPDIRWSGKRERSEYLK